MNKLPKSDAILYMEARNPEYAKRYKYYENYCSPTASIHKQDQHSVSNKMWNSVQKTLTDTKSKVNANVNQIYRQQKKTTMNQQRKFTQTTNDDNRYVWPEFESMQPAVKKKKIQITLAAKILFGSILIFCFGSFIPFLIVLALLWVGIKAASNSQNKKKN